MAEPLDSIVNILMLLSTASFMVVIALVWSRLDLFKTTKSKKANIATKISIGILLGLLAIFGTYEGVKLSNGTIINVRELAGMIGGLAGGPVGGTIAGVIGGIHRYTVGGATALSCAISTIGIGVVAGLVSTRISGKWYLLKGAAVGFLSECAAMVLILVLVPPLSTALMIVEAIAAPMIAANTIGLVFWVYLAQKFKKQTEPA